MSDSAFSKVLAHRPAGWVNPRKLSADIVKPLCSLLVSEENIRDAELRLRRFAPFIEALFPETAPTGGIIESELRAIPSMQDVLGRTDGNPVPGRLFLKMDSHLPIAGSVKARGGIYEVLKHAEDLALAAGLLQETDEYSVLTGYRDFFSQYTVQVGSTGNLGLSIGIMSAALGFRVRIHMSADAKQWKKDLLRARGAEVVEYADDYSRAVAEGRKLSEADPSSYFVDDEKSVDLFLGYAAAAGRLKGQLDAQGISVDAGHPLLVYIPAGVGGAPGGITFGLRQIFGDAVHCFFAEPVECPSLLLGMATGKFGAVRVQDYGLSGRTEADGLACASPSDFVTRIMTPHLAGIFTV
ncbi:MAG: D-serine ammonia-lyase, partial [Clostridia bacterium]|nr:D-serine ammonia-lyase [Clostridia bacterium]